MFSASDCDIVIYFSQFHIVCPFSLGSFLLFSILFSLPSAIARMYWNKKLEIRRRRRRSVEKKIDWNWTGKAQWILSLFAQCICVLKSNEQRHDNETTNDDCEWAQKSHIEKSRHRVQIICWVGPKLARLSLQKRTNWMAMGEQQREQNKQIVELFAFFAKYPKRSSTVGWIEFVWSRSGCYDSAVWNINSWSPFTWHCMLRMPISVCTIFVSAQRHISTS